MALTADQEVRLGPFQGLSYEDSQTNVGYEADDAQGTKLAECINFDIGSKGQLVRRPGIRHVQTIDGTSRFLGWSYIAGKMNMHFQTGFTGRMQVVWHANLAITNFANPNGTASMQRGDQYNDIMYFPCGTGGLYTYNGAALTHIAGAPFSFQATVYQDRLFVYQNSRLYFSELGDFTATGWPGVNFLDVNPGDGSGINFMMVIRDRLVLFKSTGIWVLNGLGAPESWSLFRISKLTTNLRASGSAVPVQWRGSVYFPYKGGLAVTDGVSVSELPNSMSGLFRDGNEYTSLPFLFFNDKILLFPQNSNLTPLVYDLKKQTWTYYQFPAFAGQPLSLFNHPEVESGQFEEHSAYIVYDTKLTRLSPTNWADLLTSGDSDSPIVASIRTKDLDFRDRFRLKRVKEFLVEYGQLSAAGTFTMTGTFSIDGTDFVYNPTVGLTQGNNWISGSPPESGQYFKRSLAKFKRAAGSNFLRWFRTCRFELTYTSPGGFSEIYAILIRFNYRGRIR